MANKFVALDIDGPAFGFNEDGFVQQVNREYKRVQRLDATVDTPEKFIAWLTNMQAATPTNAQLFRIFRRMLAASICWRPNGGIGREVGEGIGVGATDDGGAV